MTSLECARLDGYRADEGTGLRLFWTTGGGGELERVEVAEYDDRVVIGVVERVPNGPRTLEAAGAQHVVTLSRPLGDRKVIDATTGRRVPHASGGS